MASWACAAAGSCQQAASGSVGSVVSVPPVVLVDSPVVVSVVEPLLVPVAAESVVEASPVAAVVVDSEPPVSWSGSPGQAHSGIKTRAAARWKGPECKGGLDLVSIGTRGEYPGTEHSITRTAIWTCRSQRRRRYVLDPGAAMADVDRLRMFRHARADLDPVHERGARPRTFTNRIL